MSDDPNQEKHFVRLADQLLELLELQWTGLQMRIKFIICTNSINSNSTTTSNSSNQIGLKLYESPNSLGIFSKTSSNQLDGSLIDPNEQIRINYFLKLARNMSRKFGFAVDHLTTEPFAHPNLASMDLTELKQFLIKRNLPTVTNLNSRLVF